MPGPSSILMSSEGRVSPPGACTGPLDDAMLHTFSVPEIAWHVGTVLGIGPKPPSVHDVSIPEGFKKGKHTILS